MRETGIITRVDTDTVDISITMNEGCHSCGNKDACGTAGKIVTALKNGHECTVGEKAEIEIANASLWALAVFMVIPLILTVVGYFAGKYFFTLETFANLMGAGGLFLGVAVVYLLGKARLFNIKPYVVDVYTKEDGANNTCCNVQ